MSCTLSTSGKTHKRPPLATLALALLAALLLFSAHARAQQEEVEGGEVGDRSDEVASALRDVLTEQGMRDDEADQVLYLLGIRLLRQNSVSKRMGWKRIPIQTRFAAFGTKLVPSRHHGESSGPNLLRYGRSA